MLPACPRLLVSKLAAHGCKLLLQCLHLRVLLQCLALLSLPIAALLRIITGLHLLVAISIERGGGGGGIDMGGDICGDAIRNGFGRGFDRGR